ncbi:Serine/threonine-protein kinase tel1 [Scheffersomyces spartinae]|uniref:Serine/threonine-protein kinase TEL1 n=1 Tax=Scheffersomyces spartinae TaxID=45513 RepID=A0A9P8AK97_9ASCO|nr:Serine/threonine-protein kinase tel1 [Scheffersomyces spartinae]KAG7194927.1 Serine/threonine-protein kinase tel1 [Scheffersomyces spartinae]
MSTLDISKIAIALGSTKIKDRSDALSLLEELTNSQTTINSKSFKIIGSAIFDSIERELEAINKTTRQKSGPAITRLERMTVVVRGLVEKSLLSENRVVRLNYGNYLDVILGFIKHFKLGVESGLNLTMESFTRIINSIVSQDGFVCHISYSEWYQIFSFITNGINNGITLIQYDQFNNRIVSQLLLSLCNLLNCSKNIPLNHLHIYTNDNYKLLLKILKKSAELPQLSPNTAITLIKIINKLIIGFCTEDIMFVHCLIFIGINLVLRFVRTNLDGLKTQMGIFLNLEQMHCFLDPTSFKQEPYQENDNFNSFTIELDKITYKLKLLVLDLLSVLEETSFTFKSSSLLLKYPTQISARPSQGILPSVYLSTGGLLNTFLLISGVAKLVNSFYLLKMLHNSILYDEEESLSSSSLSLLTSNKRRKVSSIISSFHAASSSIQFFKTLISNKNEPKSILLGLQLILIQSDLGMIKYDVSDSGSPSNELMKTSSGKNDDDEISGYDFSILLSDSFTKKSLLVVLLELIEILEYREWSFLCCRSILFWIPKITTNTFTKKTVSTFCDQLISKSMAYVNVLDVAADSIYICTKLCDNYLNQQHDLSPDLIKLLQNIDSKGPRNLCTSSYHFWYGCNMLLLKGSPTFNVFSLTESAQEWLISRMQHSQTGEYIYCQEFALFIEWLIGFEVSIPLRMLPLNPNHVGIGLECFNDKYMELFLFISKAETAEKTYHVNFPDYWHESMSISSSNDPSNFLLRLLHVPRISLQDPVSLLRWSFVLSQIATCLGNKKINEYVVETIESYTLSLVHEAHLLSMTSDQLLTYADSFCFKELSDVNHNYLKHYVPDFDSILPATTDSQSKNSLDLAVFSALDSAFDSVGQLQSPPALELSSSASSSSDALTEGQLAIYPLETLKKLKLVCSLVGLKVWESNRILDYIKPLKGITFASCVLYFLTELDKGILLSYGALDLPFLTTLIQGIGTKLLATKFDRFEVTQVLVCRFSCMIMEIIDDYSHANQEQFNKFKLNSEDITEWLVSSFNKGHFGTESALREYFMFSVNHSKYNEAEQFIGSFCKDLESTTNNLKASIKDSFVILLNHSKYPMTYYRDIYSQIGNFLNSMEQAISSCLILSWLGVHVNSISCPSLFNLLEGTKNLCLQPYIMAQLKNYVDYYEVSSAKDLFSLQKRELLTYWCHFNDIHLFPFGLLGFTSMNEFLSTNSTELVAIDVSTIKKKKGDDEATISIIEDLVAIKQSSEYSIIVDSIPLIIPFAYTRNGIRNKVFDYLKQKLGPNSKKEISAKITLIIYQILQYTNISKEPLTIETEGGKSQCDLSSNNHIVLEDISSLSITLATSLDLMSTLISRFSNDNNSKTEYWNSLAVVHFLLKRITCTLHKSFSLNVKVALIRRIKLVLLLSHKCNLHFKTLRVVINELMPLISHKELVEDVFKILNYLTRTNVFSLDHDRALVLAIQIIEGLLKNNNLNTKEYATLLLNIETNLSTSSHHELIHKILEICVNHLKFKETKLHPSLVEEFIAKEIMLFGDVKIQKLLIRLISAIFVVVKKAELDIGIGKETNPEVARFLLNFDEQSVGLLSDKFAYWRSQYLANHYLNGNKTEKLIVKREFETELSVPKFTDYCSTLNPIVKKILAILDNLARPSDSICSESILSVLVWKIEHNKKDLRKCITVDLLNEDFILPLDFHSCMLINSEEQDLEYSIDEFVEQMHNSNYLQAMEPSSLAKQLCLFILEKISTVTTIGPLISIGVIRVSEFGLSIFPFLLLFCIKAFGYDAVKDVMQFFETYMGLNSGSGSSLIKKMISDTIIMIRYGAKLEYPPFVEIYNKVNLILAISNCIETKSFRMALILLEDAYIKGTEIPQEVTLVIYESIDNEDMIYGSYETLNNTESLLRLINLGNQSSSTKSLYASARYDASLYSGGSGLGSAAYSDNLVKTLLSNGAMGISRALSKWEPGVSSSFEWGWKLNRWEQPTTATSIHSEPRYDELMYSLLQQVSVDHNEGLRFIESFSLPSTKCSSTKLSLKEISDKNELYLRSLAAIMSVKDILCVEDKEDVYKRINQFSRTTSWFLEDEFLRSEDILIARRNALQLLLNKQSTLHCDTFKLGALTEVIRYGNIARRNSSSDLQKTINSTMLLLEFLNGPGSPVPGVNAVVKFNTALSLWKQGMSVEAVNILKSLLLELNNNGVLLSFPIESMCLSKALINATLAEWLAISRQELPATIMSDYIEPTLEELEFNGINVHHHLVTVYRKFAHFCHSQYNSGLLQDKISLLYKRLEERKKEIDELKDHYGKTLVGSEEKRLAQKYYARLKQEYQVEHEELKKLRRLKETFAIMATPLYLKSVHVSSSSDSQRSVRDDFDKFFSLWFEDKNRSSDNLINKLASEIPSKYFCDWASQLVSRLEGMDSNDEFQDLLHKIIMNVSRDLPYHMLYPLMSLRISGLYEGDLSLNRKAVAANKIWRTLVQRESEEYISLMNYVDLFCNESVKLAEFKGSKGRSINLDKLDASIGDYWLHQLPYICPPTLIGESYGSVDNVPKMVLIKPRVIVAASGLSLPKVATFVLSDGTEHKMLFKHGSDDLRQDSIMEQVFSKVNLFLIANKETRKRNLRIRTYNAIPLGPKSGIIEFVNNTAALIDILKPLHDAYDSYKMDKCRTLMRDVQARDKAERVLTYQRITEKCTPKLHYFFMSEFGTPDSWFECILNYIHGVATTSFVGYMVGLGDRHCNNILIDKLSGEPVHIDLGVAFDLGKLLTVPETVPFRLTRDMVAGLGINGTKGAFTQSSEHVFRVLLDNKDHIMTILDVLKWDPLYSWSLSPLKRKKLQDTNTTNDRLKRGVQVDEYEAQRAINTVADKLTGGGLSVEATVRQLIQDATNPDNLALIYWGWSPFY